MSRRRTVFATQLAIVVVFLLAWEFVPKLAAILTTERIHLLDSFFISSPSRIVTKLYAMGSGQPGVPLLWRYVYPTVAAAVVGIACGLAVGSTLGLVLSNWKFMSEVFRPFIVALNTIPKVALIPIVMLLLGPTFAAIVLMSSLVVFFITFHNAYEGGRTVANQLVQSSQLLGASKMQIMLNVRLPYVLAWTLAALPPAAAYAVISVVTAEILTGSFGMGALIYVAAYSADSSLSFAVVVVLSVLGVSIVTLAEQIKRRVLHWWGA